MKSCFKWFLIWKYRVIIYRVYDGVSKWQFSMLSFVRPSTSGTNSGMEKRVLSQKRNQWSKDLFDLRIIMVYRGYNINEKKETLEQFSAID